MGHIVGIIALVMFAVTSLIIGIMGAADAREEGKPAFIIVFALFLYAIFWLPLIVAKYATDTLGID